MRDAGVAQLVEQLICNQQVGGSSPSTSSKNYKLNMGEFPSGQRGQTVNLLSVTSMVRIHLPPPKSTPNGVLFIFLWGNEDGFESPCPSRSGTKICRWHIFRAWRCTCKKLKYPVRPTVSDETSFGANFTSVFPSSPTKKHTKRCAFYFFSFLSTLLLSS